MRKLSLSAKVLRGIGFMMTWAALSGGFPAVAAETEEQKPVWRIDFSDSDTLKKEWEFRGGKFRVPKTKFFAVGNDEGSDGSVLVVEADKSTGLLVTLPENVDLERYPIMRWRWRIVRRLSLADGQPDPDDQAAVVYLGDGSSFRQRCVGYRWEHNTEVGKSGTRHYAGGLMTVKWFCVRNRLHPLNEWCVEERDVFTDYREAFGDPPNKVFALSIGANSQYTRSSTRVEIDYIEFVARDPENGEAGDTSPGARTE